MIDPKEQRPISFKALEQPELPEIEQVAIDAELQAREQQKLETVSWLTEHNDWDPFGVEW